MAEATKSHGSRIGFLGLLTLLFIALKLTGYIDWSWWWVLAPLWGPFAFFAVLLVVAVVIDLIEARRWNRLKRSARRN